MVRVAQVRQIQLAAVGAPAAELALTDKVFHSLNVGLLIILPEAGQEAALVVGRAVAAALRQEAAAAARFASFGPELQDNSHQHA